MSKKDYELIARALRESEAPAGVVEHVARTLQANYSGPYSFNYGKFIEAATAKEGAAQALSKTPLQLGV